MARTNSPSRPFVTLAMLALLAACGDDDAAVAEPEPTRIALAPTQIIGEVDGDPSLLFGDVRSIAVGDNGTVYVGDRIGATVRAYSSDGEYLGTLAAEGEGPGELYGWPSDLTLDSRGSLHVRDASRVTTFAQSGRAIADSLADLWTVAGYGNLTYTRSQVGADGVYYYPNGSQRAGERPWYYYEVVRDGEPTGDTLWVPDHAGMPGRATAFYQVSAGSGRMVALSRVPFAAVPSWAVTPEGTVISTDGASHELIETGLQGDTIRRIPLGDASPRPISAGERGDSLRALEARIDSLPVPLDEVMNLGAGVRERELPDVLPPVVAVHIGQDGRIWVERWPNEGAPDARAYDVFDRSGAFQVSLRLEAPLVSEPSPYFGRGWVVGVIRDDGTGVQRAALFRLPDEAAVSDSR